MDATDEGILDQVKRGTVRYSAIAKRLGVPPSTVHFRIKRLEREKVITGYRGEVDWKKAGLNITAFVFVNTDVNLLKQIKKSQGKLLDEILRVPYVEEGHIITGESDMLIKVVAKDTEHLREILMDYIDSKEGVVKTKTVIAL